jgi:hypothetical protein
VTAKDRNKIARLVAFDVIKDSFIDACEIDSDSFECIYMHLLTLACHVRELIEKQKVENE